MTYRRFLKILLWIVKGVTLGLALFLFIWLFNKYFYPLGKLTLNYDFSGDSEYISQLGPWQRVSHPEEVDRDWFQRMKDDLVYFDVKPLRWFQKVAVEVAFRNSDQIVLEIGAKVNAENGYEDKPLQNMLIDDLKWNKINEGELTLFQREKKFENIQEFISNIPPDQKTGVYFYKPPFEERIISDYHKSSQKIIIDQTLRGPHTIFTYLKDENLDFNFYKMDLNRYQGPDRVKIEVFNQKNSEKIYNAEIPDDGIEKITGNLSSEQTFSLSLTNLEEGVYRIELKGNQDFLIRKIITAQHLIVFSNTLFLADNEEYFKNFISGSKPTTIFSDATKVKLKTSHPLSLQEVVAGDQKINLQEVNKDYAVQLSGITKIILPKNDVSLESDGFFAFSEKQYFYPRPTNIVNLRKVTDPNSLDYIIAKYSPPIEKNGWLVKSQTFESRKLYQDKDGKIRFRLSAPGLGEEGKTVQISNIKITFEKPAITIKNFPTRLKNFIIRQFKKI